MRDNELNREIGVGIFADDRGRSGNSRKMEKSPLKKLEASPKGSYDLILWISNACHEWLLEATAAVRILPGEKGKLPIVAMTAQCFCRRCTAGENTGMNGHIAETIGIWNKLNDVLKNWL